MSRGLLVSRRSLLGAAGALPVLPSVLAAPPAPESLLRRILDIELLTAAPVDLPAVAGRHWRLTVTGGRFDGTGLRGTVLGGIVEGRRGGGERDAALVARYTLALDGGGIVVVEDEGRRGVTADGSIVIRSAPRFVADGAAAWLSDGVHVGIVDDTSAAGEGRLRIRVLRLG